ncbi:unnamed protein product [Rotaria magnacalcarata]|uniref:Uncharacterized protein n=3 Tax=Rotaria magnacalcarata TaxID=392030 RepID=A0A819STR3_9BILA|nr:unnamed protein product [Rotaria magnacalcarata]CAF4066444.1 unnamed protein product [Rotaria magnacalcarata]CAF4100036.1 unnamed protein product [Rotaria magnacalcarata]
MIFSTISKDSIDDLILCLPNNRQMSIQLYCHYLKKIVSKHASQIDYLHLSERSAPCAVDYFLSQLFASIRGCSRELLTELLNNGHLPRLQNLRVTFSMTHDDIENELPLPISLKQAFASELRHINLKIFAGTAWVLTFFEDLLRYSQLDRMTISSYEGFAD